MEFGSIMKHLISLFILIFSTNAFATQQIPEEFDVDMAKFEINEQPLDSFIGPDEFKKRFKPDICSANWRGYKGYWALRDNKLVLRHLVQNACSKDPKSIDIEKLFGNKRYPIEATWYTGKITIRISKRNYLKSETTGHSGVEYEAIVYEFQKGKLVSRKIETVTKRW
jgi:hypothetical protein